MFDVNNVTKKLLDKLNSEEKINEGARRWDIIYKILQVCGVIGAGAALLEFGITVPFFVASGLIGTSLLGVDLLKVRPLKRESANLKDEKAKLAIEIASNIQTPVDLLTFKPELVAVDDKTVPAKYVDSKTNTEVSYGKVGKTTYYYHYNSEDGLKHLLSATEVSYEDRCAAPGGDGYVTRIRRTGSVAGLEKTDEDKLPADVQTQISNSLAKTLVKK